VILKGSCKKQVDLNGQICADSSKKSDIYSAGKEISSLKQACERFFFTYSVD
jgi:hypothetical protein